MTEQNPYMQGPQTNPYMQGPKTPLTKSEKAAENIGITRAEQNAMDLFPGSAPMVFGFKRGTENAKSGLMQLWANFTGDDEAFNQEQQAIAQRDAEVEQMGPWAQGGSLAGEVAPTAVLPGGPAGGLVKRVAGGVASDVLASVADPVREGQTRQGNLQNVAIGSGVLRTGGGFIGAITNRISNARAGNIADPEIRELIKNADANEISLFFDDATQAPLALKASVAAEVFGMFGTSRGRARQGQEALAAAERWLQKYSGSIDDYGAMVQSGLENKYRMFQRAASRRYKMASDKIAAATGGNPVTLKTPQFDSAIDQAIAMETAKGDRSNKAVISILENYKNSPRGSFEDMIEFRSDLNNDIRRLYEGENRPNKTSSDALRLAQQAVDADMDAFARSAGAEKEWRAANEFYRENVVPFQVGKLKALTNKNSAANFDEQAAWRYLSQSTAKEGRAKRMWHALDNDGRAAVRAGLLAEAYDASIKEGAPFSPARFAASLEKRMAVANEFFRGQSGDELRGLIKVMRHIERAGQFAENPPTGNRVIPFLLAGSATVEPTTVAIATGTAMGIKGLFQTKAGRDLLLAANGATPGSAEFNRILEQIERTIARSISSEESTQPQQQ